MTDGVSIDDSELRAFAADLSSAPSRLLPKVRAVVVRGGVNIKRQRQSEFGASPSFKGVARAESFDIIVDADGIEAQVGPTKGPGEPGNLANIAIFGTSRGGGTVPDPQGALDAEIPRFEKALGDAMEESL